jgi:diguanylate cyclase (GGDEF)-like protein
MMARKCIGYILLFCIGLACCWMVSFPGLGQEDEVARVLFINSYHRGYSWSDGIEDGLRERLAASEIPIELSMEFLDRRRFAYGQQVDFLAQSMAVKYSRYRPDVVVVADNAAFDFAAKYRQDLFANVPIVFCGYNSFRPAVLEGLDNITGVNEEIAMMDTVEMALKIHPRTKTIAFIVSTGEESSKRIKAVAEESVFPILRQRFEVVVLADASIADIQSRLAALPPNTLVFLSGQTSTQGDGRALTPMENGRLITRVSPFPVYTFWDFHLGSGAIGGRIITGPEQGKAAADLALRILAGEAADDIPVVMTTPTRDIFDYSVMRQFGLWPREVPADAIILNQPFLVWEEYRWQIIATVSLVVLQSLFIALLLKMMRERRLALRTLHQERERLEERVEERTNALQLANQRLAYLSRTDALTGLANRRCFDETLMTEFLRMQRCHHPLSLILLDVDHFKSFNDHYGHVMGDHCLRRIGSEIGKMVSHPPDLAARYGGEEFALILPETDLAGSIALAERLRRQVEQLALPHQFSGTQPHVTISLGVSTVMAQDVPHAKDLIRLADQALYQAKLQGRNRTISQALSFPTAPTQG